MEKMGHFCIAVSPCPGFTEMLISIYQTMQNTTALFNGNVLKWDSVKEYGHESGSE
jgi:hypothetical protein